MGSKVREDMILVTDSDDMIIPETNLNEKRENVEEKIIADKNDVRSKEEGMFEEKSLDENLIAGRNEIALTETTMISETESAPSEDISADEFTRPVTTGLAIEKSGLNFRQVNPTQKEQEEILELKKKVQILKKSEKLE